MMGKSFNKVSRIKNTIFYGILEFKGNQSETDSSFFIQNGKILIVQIRHESF